MIGRVGFAVFGVWIVGLFFAGVLNPVATAESDRVRAVARVAFGAVLAVELLACAGLLSAGNANPVPAFRPSRTGWWALAVGAAIPVTLVLAVSARTAFQGRTRRAVLAIATLAACGLYICVPYAFEPVGQRLRGLARFGHDHHVLVVIALLLPGLVAATASASSGRSRASR